MSNILKNVWHKSILLLAVIFSEVFDFVTLPLTNLVIQEPHAPDLQPCGKFIFDIIAKSKIFFSLSFALKLNLLLLIIRLYFFSIL